MAKHSVIMAILVHAMIATLIPVGHGVAEAPEGVGKWFRNLPQAKEKLTELHFYFHDIVSDDNPTAVTIAQPDSSRKLPNAFGVVNMMDDPLTVGPAPDSKIIGRAQGIYGSASLEDFGLLMSLNFVFTDGVYNGSTLSVLGRNPALHQHREMPIVGGSGVFRLARGIATAHTFWFNVSSGDAIVEYHVTVLQQLSDTLSSAPAI